jgi:hypothetical protein
MVQLIETDEKQMFKRGCYEGERWARVFATPVELKHLRERAGGLRRESGDLIDFYSAMHPESGADKAAARRYWAAKIAHEDELKPFEFFCRGFLEGALAVVGECADPYVRGGA